MRKIFLVMALWFGLTAAPPLFADDVVAHQLGAGVIVSTSPYVGVGAKIMPIPLVSWKYKDFYIRGVEAGYVLYEKYGWQVSAMAVPRLMGYSSDDSLSLRGMEDRQESLDAGMKAKVELPFIKGLFFEAQVLNDALSRNDGREGSFRLEQANRFKYCHLISTFGVRIQSRQLTEYYYGVRAEEALASRPLYEPGYAVNPFLNFMITTKLSERWIVMAHTGLERLDKSISKSPIVGDNYTFRMVLGLLRRF